LRVIKAAKAKSTNARGEAKLAPELALGGALAVLVPLLVVAVLEADPLEVVLAVPVEERLEEVMVEFEAPVVEAEEAVEVVDPEAELEEAGPPVI